MADLINGIVTEIFEDEETLKIIFGFVLPLLAYLIVGLVFIAYDHLHVSWKCGCCKRSNTSIREPLTLSCPKGLEWIKIPIKVCTIIGGILYFVGDNLYKIDVNAHTLTTVFLVHGVLIYRIIPLALKKLQRYFKDESNEHKSRGFDCCLPNDNETHSLIVAYAYLLPIAIDFDVWLTVVYKKADDGAVVSLCNRKNESDVKILWSLYGGMTIFFLIIELIIITIFIKIACCRTKSEINRLKLIPPTRKIAACIGCIVLDGFLSLVVLIAVGFFLIADNRHLLDYYNIENERELRATLLSFSFVVTAVVTIGFFCRRLCCCVQVKGEIISVDVVQDNQLKVYFEDKTGIHVFTYQIDTSEITDSDCNHAELYKDDIECISKTLRSIGKLTKMNLTEDPRAVDTGSDHPLYTKNDIESIVKSLGGDSMLVAVNVRDDQIAVIREVEGKLYLMLHYTSKPTKTEMYKIRDEKNSPPESDEFNDFGPGELITIYCQNQYQHEQVCVILLQNLDEVNYAVQKMKPRDATRFKDYTSFNIWTEQKVLAVPKDQAPRHSIILYDKNAGHFDFQHVDQMEDTHIRTSKLQNNNRNYRGSINGGDRCSILLEEPTEKYT